MTGPRIHSLLQKIWTQLIIEILGIRTCLQIHWKFFYCLLELSDFLQGRSLQLLGIAFGLTPPRAGEATMGGIHSAF